MQNFFDTLFENPILLIMIFLCILLIRTWIEAFTVPWEGWQAWGTESVRSCGGAMRRLLAPQVASLPPGESCLLAATALPRTLETTALIPLPFRHNPLYHLVSPDTLICLLWRPQLGPSGLFA